MEKDEKSDMCPAALRLQCWCHKSTLVPDIGSDNCATHLEQEGAKMPPRSCFCLLQTDKEGWYNSALASLAQQRLSQVRRWWQM